MKKPYIVGIGGGTASGKSTLCARLEQVFSGWRVRAFHLDEYFREDRPTVEAPFTGKPYRDDNHPANTLDLDQAAADLAEAAASGGYDLILLEGAWALSWETLREQFDLKLFVDCRSDERLVRRIRRNTAWGLSFDEITNVYLDLVRYRHDEFVEPARWYADLVLNGSGMPETGERVVTDYICTQLDQKEDSK